MVLSNLVLLEVAGHLCVTEELVKSGSEENIFNYILRLGVF